jgi:signal transduction histidine kinase/ligand-binding sensor domain-containing protein
MHFPGGLHNRMFSAVLCLLVSIARVVAEQSPGATAYTIKVWGADDGLTEGSVTDVAQTPEGYLWIGTLFGSVLRFDGVRFTSFSSANTPEFSLKWGVPKLMVDQEGTLWISTYDGGMTTWDRNGFRAVFTSTNTPNRLLWSAQGRVIFSYAGGGLLCGQRQGQHWAWTNATLPGALLQNQQCADAQGRIWYLRTNGALGIWAAGTNKSLTLNSELPGERFTVLAADLRRRIWVGTDQALATTDGDHFELMTPANGESVLKVKRIVPSAGGVWVEANGKMRRWAAGKWDGESQAWEREMGELPVLRFAHGDGEGGLWAGVGDLGLIHVSEDGAFQRLTTRDGLPSNRVQFAYQDHDGNTWTGYERGGLVRVRRRLFQPVGNSDGLNENLINTVCEDAEGGVWMGTHVGTVARCKDGECVDVPLPVSARAQDSMATADSKGRVWIGSQGAGLMMWETGQVKRVASPAELQGYARLMWPARDGRLWLGTLLSVFSVEEGKLNRVYTAQTTGDHPTGLAETTDGALWIGTLSGMLLHRVEKEFVRIEPPGRESLGRIWALWPDADGGLWAGTSEGGLLHWHDKKFARFTTKEGLPSDSIEQVLGDENGGMWLGTRSGIGRVARSELALVEKGELAQVHASLYGPSDGLLTTGSAIMFQPNCWRGAQGRLFFAMANSVVSVDPREARVNLVPPTPVLESVKADEKIVWPARGGDVSTHDQPEPEDAEANLAETPVLTVGPGRGDLEFRFTGLSLGSPSLVRFKYKLEGSEKQWNQGGEQRTAAYRHVPPGKHVFRLMARNSDGIWSDEKSLMTVIVQPFFYQTAWFQIGAVVASLGVLSLVAGTTMRRRMKRRLEALRREHELERERARIAQDLHDDLGAGLTEISLLGGMLQRPGGLSGGSDLALPRIVQRCRDLVTALDEIVWAINPRHDSANSLTSYLCRYAEEFLQPTAIRCRFEVREAQPDRPLDSEQRHHLFLAFKEVLANVARHSNANEVCIRISIDEEQNLLIAIEDDGKGLPQSAAAKGDGLANLRKRMGDLGGACEIGMREHGGVTVQLCIPLPVRDK